MKRIFLFLTLLPLAVSAHRDDPRVRTAAPYDGVKSVKTMTFFTVPKENNRLDTCSVETEVFNTGGLLTQHDFSMILRRSPRYDYQEKYTYASQDAWTKRVYKSGTLTDSVVVNGSWANWYFFNAGKTHALYEYRTDSMQEKMINGGDTVFRPKKVLTDTSSDEFWDYRNAGSFARKAVTTDKDGAATVTYYNEKDEKLVTYVEHRVAGGPVSEIDYYNYSVKRFDFKRLTYSEKMDMTLFLKKSRKGQWSYQVLYTYNEQKELIEERWNEPGAGRNQVVRKYEYVFY